jgi:hypothetical protein
MKEPQPNAPKPKLSVPLASITYIGPLDSEKETDAKMIAKIKKENSAHGFKVTFDESRAQLGNLTQSQDNKEKPRQFKTWYL